MRVSVTNILKFQITNFCKFVSFQRLYTILYCASSNFDIVLIYATFIHTFTHAPTHTYTHTHTHTHTHAHSDLNYVIFVKITQSNPRATETVLVLEV